MLEKNEIIIKKDVEKLREVGLDYEVIQLLEENDRLLAQQDINFEYFYTFNNGR